MDPELEAFIHLLPRIDLTDPVADRKTFAAMASSAPAPDTADMEVEDRTVPADPGVPVRIYRPHRAQGAIVWMHGGGLVMGDLDTEHRWAPRLAAGSGAVVISVGYRLAPENRYPAALDDAYAALTWTAEHAAELGIDPERIAVGGHSAGAGLAAAVALRARDEQEPPIRFQLLNEATFDDRQQTWSARNFTDTPWLYRDKVTASWRHYLGSQPATPYAAQARAHRLVWPAIRVRLHRRVRPEPRRRHRLRAAPPPGGRLGRAAPVARHVPRLAGHPVRRGVTTATRRTRLGPAPRPGRVRSAHAVTGCRFRGSSRPQLDQGSPPWIADRDEFP